MPRSGRPGRFQDERAWRRLTLEQSSPAKSGLRARRAIAVLRDKTGWVFNPILSTAELGFMSSAPPRPARHFFCHVGRKAPPPVAIVRHHAQFAHTYDE